jgi:hypothetical protein
VADFATIALCRGFLARDSWMSEISKEISENRPPSGSFRVLERDRMKSEFPSYRRLKVGSLSQAGVLRYPFALSAVRSPPLPLEKSTLTGSGIEEEKH